MATTTNTVAPKSSTWDSLWPIIVAGIVGSQTGGGSGGTPNQYPIQLTPEQKRIFDEMWRVYQAGGSDTQKAVRSAGMQFLGGMPTGAPGFKFMSPELQGQPFAGGVTPPKIDLSKFSIPGGNGGPPSAPGNITLPPRDPVSPGPGGMRDRIESEDRPGLGNPFPTPNPDTLRGMDDIPAPGSDADKSLREAWDSFRAAHPNWAALGVNAVITAIASTTGMAGALVGNWLRRTLLSDPPPNANGTIPGVRLTPGDPIPVHGMPVDPNFGRDRFADARNRYHTDVFNNALRGGGGGDIRGQASTNPNVMFDDSRRRGLM